jgi:hypothetical protein
MLNLCTVISKGKKQKWSNNYTLAQTPASILKGLQQAHLMLSRLDICVLPVG